MNVHIFYLGIILLYTASSVAGATDANFDTKPPKSVRQILEGKDLYINCSAIETDDVTVFWVKNDTNTSFIQNGTTLTFVNITRNMSGNYICYTQNLTSDANATEMEVVKVDVLYPAEIVEFKISKNVVNERNYFDVKCKFDGNPIPSWTIGKSKDKPRTVVEGSTTVDARVQARCEDQGLWECTGRNSLNTKKVTRSGNVTVFCAPHPVYDYMKEKGYSIKARLYGTCILDMRDYANPPANYTWSKNNVVFPPEAHTDVASGNVGASLLLIDNVGVEDFGTYRLNMSNVYGSDIRHYELIPVGPPKRPTSLSYSDVTYHSAKIHWVSGFNGGTQQYFVVIRFVDGEYVQFSPNITERSTTTYGVGEHYEYELTDLQPDTFYLLYIQTDNNQGYGAVRSDEEAMFNTLVAPWQTTTAFPFFDDCCTVGVIVGASFGGAGLFVAIIGVVMIIVLRNRRKSYAMLTSEKMVHHQNAPPQQLGITPDMAKGYGY